jgi:biopolymer transport protein ExbD
MNFRKIQKADSPGFQIAPMIDIMFLLLSFFIASQLFSRWEKEIDIKLPTAEKGKLPDKLPGEVIINVTSEGGIVVNNKSYTGEELKTVLRKLAETWPGQPVLIRGDESADFRHVIRVLDICRQVDIWNVSFATLMPDPRAKAGVP